MRKPIVVFFIIMVLAGLSAWISLPQSWPIQFAVGGKQIAFNLRAPTLNLNLFGKTVSREFVFKQGLDLQGGMQVVLEADMNQLAPEDRLDALESAREIILRRVDLYGISEPVVQTAVSGDTYRILVELPGVSDPAEALSLVGQTAQLDFQILDQSPIPVSSISAEVGVDIDVTNPEPATVRADLTSPFGFTPTGLTGEDLKKATPQFDQQTGEPVVAISFTSDGAKKFADITTKYTGSALAIMIDGVPIMAPQIQVPILDGQAIISGGFTAEVAQQLSIQLNAGALPVPISVLEQRTVGASLGQLSVQQSLEAGLVGVGIVMLFMILYYGLKGVLASLALVMYALYTLALYKILGVTLTLPGIAGLLLSVGMAVDANILVFERMKEELRLGKPFNRALELGFGRAWDSIKDANVATIFTALVLINPLNVSFLNTAGMVRGFGITLLIGVLLSLFTGVVVTRTLMRLFLTDTRTNKE